MSLPEPSPPTLRTAVLRHRWPLLLLVGVPVLLLAVAAAAFLPSRYDARSVVTLSPEIERGAGADLVRLALPSYAVALGARTSVDRVAAGLGVSGEVDVEVTTPTEAGYVEVTVTSGDAAQSADVANGLAALAVARAGDDPLISAQQTVEAVPATRPSGPPRTLILLAGLVAAVAAAVATVIATERLSPRVWSTDEVAALAGRGDVLRLRHVPPPGPALAAVRSRRGAAAAQSLLGLVGAEAGTPVRPALAFTAPADSPDVAAVATMLGAAAAGAGAGVGLVEADFGRAPLGEQVGTEADVHVLPWPLADVRQTEASGRRVASRLLALPGRVDVEALLAVPRTVRAMVLRLGREQDVVLVCAPALTEGGAAVVAAVGDGCDTVLVVPVGSRRDLLSAGAAALARGGVSPVATVVVDRRTLLWRLRARLAARRAGPTAPAVVPLRTPARGLEEPSWSASRTGGSRA
jgi:capsular polysaccharide biosynthesis protein